MKRAALVLLAAAALLPVAAGAGEPIDAVPGGFSTPNVEYLGHIPLNYDSAGARIRGHYLYLTTSRDLRIFDISDPADPQLVGSLLYPQTVYFAQEDVDTNGRVLLVGRHVIDVEDKSNPVLLGAGTNPGHTITCVLDCRWAYSSSGGITDLRDPSSPKPLQREWGYGKPIGTSHDVTEVAPGLVVTSSVPLMLLDARKTPGNPRLLAIGIKGVDGRGIIHGNLWPRRARDRFLLVGSEVGGPQCTENSASFMTFDTRRWISDGRLEPVDRYRLSNGLPTEGKAVANTFCAHWFDAHPEFRNGGFVSLAWYEHGTRFLRVRRNGKIDEVGWFVPHGGATSAAYWANDEIVYAVDYNRGLDILRFKPRRGDG